MITLALVVFARLIDGNRSNEGKAKLKHDKEAEKRTISIYTPMDPEWAPRTIHPRAVPNRTEHLRAEPNRGPNARAR